MDAGQHWIYVNNFLIFRGGFLPLSLCFKCFGVEDMNLIGEGCLACQIFRRAKRKIGEGVSGGVENFRIAREFAVQDSEEVQGFKGGIVSHGAVQTEEADALFEVAIRDLMNGFLKERQSFRAPARFRKSDGARGIGALGRRGSCGWRVLGRGLGGEKSREQQEPSAKFDHAIHHEIVHRTTLAVMRLKRKWQAPKRLPFPGVLRWKI